MKITDAESIKDGENEFIDSLTSELDWQAIETILKEKYNLKLHDDVAFKNGDIVVHGKNIAYKLDFDVRVTLSLVIDRDGECVDIKASGNQDGDDNDDSSEIPALNHDFSLSTDDNELPQGTSQKTSQRQEAHYRKNEEMASQLSEIIKEINK